MKTYIINLPQSRERRRSMSEQLKGAGLSYEFVDAVDGRRIAPAERTKLVDEATVARYPHWLTPGQIGCALSHLQAYQRFLASGGCDEVALILEDDATTTAPFWEVVTSAVPHMWGSEVVLLYFRSFDVCRFSAHGAVGIYGGARLVYPLDASQPITSTAYAITREASRRLSEVIVPVRAGADSWGHFYELGAIDALRCVIPRSAGVRKEFKSTIGYGDARPSRFLATNLLTRNRWSPVSQLFTLNRYLVERRMSRIAIVQDRSPIEVARWGPHGAPSP
jgi:glycosyl transferase family 25